MTPSELKSLYESNARNGGRHYFSRDTMKAFGDRMSNYRCKKAGSFNGEAIYMLYRAKPVKYGHLGNPHYFGESGFLFGTTNPATHAE